jgi:hypothetical protein
MRQYRLLMHVHLLAIDPSPDVDNLLAAYILMIEVFYPAHLLLDFPSLQTPGCLFYAKGPRTCRPRFFDFGRHC